MNTGLVEEQPPWDVARGLDGQERPGPFSLDERDSGEHPGRHGAVSLIDVWRNEEVWSFDDLADGFQCVVQSVPIEDLDVGELGDLVADVDEGFVDRDSGQYWRTGGSVPDGA